MADLVDTNIAKPADERPARRDGTCFYCSVPIGQRHKPDCVIVSKSVVIKVTMEVVVDVPRHWDQSNVNFKYQGSSYCVDNLLRDLGRWADLEDQNCGCACQSVTGEFVRDATMEDHQSLPVLIDLPAE